MTELLTAAQMRAIEAAAIASGEVTGLELMERAGRGVVEAIFAEWPELAAGTFRAAVLCGPGNNGGDGFVVARLLKEWGWQAEVFLYGTPEGMPPDARANYERWMGMGEVWELSTARHDFSGRDVEILSSADVLIDALFGIGLKRMAPSFEPVTSVLRKRFNDSLWLDGEQRPPRIVAIDQPSGMCADSGRELTGKNGLRSDAPYAAHLTVSFHRPKLGHYLGEGPMLCTALRVVDIGLKPEGQTPSTLRNPTEVFLIGSPKDDRQVWQKLRRSQEGNKFSHGHALVLSGGSGRGGAARMAARGALRIGAGLVSLAPPLAALVENASRVDAVMLKPVEGAGELAAVLTDARINALCLGPGLGVERAAEMLAVVLGGVGVEPRPTVIDADGLTALARDAVLFGKLHEECVLTPHGGEFARLFPDIAAKLEAPPTSGPAFSKVDATREAAACAGCVVLFKGPDTIIASPDGTCAINSAAYDRAAPWLATAGSGDVLAGFIAGLLARGFAPHQAAETAAWLHVECARSFGPGLIAEGLPEELPKVFRALGL